MLPRVFRSSRIPRQFSLRFTLGFCFGGLALLASSLLGLGMYFAVSRHIRSELVERLAEAARVAVLQIDPEQHRLVNVPADMATETYNRQQRQLRMIRDQCTDVVNVYTMRLNKDGQAIFVMDAEEDLDEIAPPGYVYDHPTPKLLEALKAQPGARQAFVDDEFVTDRWGTTVSGYVPIFAAGGRLEGVLCLDMSADMVLAYEQSYQLGVLALCLLVTIVVLPVGVIIGQKLSRPLAQLEAEMAKVQKFELDSQVVIATRVIEIASMVHQLENMKGGLRSFRKYVPADLVRQLIELGVEAKPGGESAEVSIFFSDIAGFTSVSERLTPEELVEFLGEYLSEVTSILLAHQATVDKYIGDAVMAFWNAPLPQPDHAYRACVAALECQAGISKLNRRWKEQGHEVDLQTRIGINTGEVIVGNIGSEQRISYTIIGDSVNLASRVEGTNKFYGTDILVTGATYAKVRDRIVGRIVDRVAVKGKKIPMDLYQIIGLREEVSPARVEWAEAYSRGFELYAARRFSEATGVLEQFLSLDGDDLAARKLIERCHHFLADPPAEEWDGSYASKEK